MFLDFFEVFIRVFLPAFFFQEFLSEIVVIQDVKQMCISPAYPGERAKSAVFLWEFSMAAVNIHRSGCWLFRPSL